MSDSQARSRAQMPLAALHLIAIAVGVLGMLVVLGWTMREAMRDADPDEHAVVVPESTDTVVLFVLEGVSPETLERYALRGNLMPNLAALTRESTWFHRHWAQCNATNAAFATLLTGRYASRLGLGALTRVGRESLSTEATLISEDLTAAGFRSFASLGSYLMSTEISGFDQGWERIASSRISGSTEHRNARQVLDAVQPDLWTALETEDRVFALFEFRDARAPFTAPSEWSDPALAHHLEPFVGEIKGLGSELEKAKAGAGAHAAVRKLISRRRGHPARVALEEAELQAELQHVDQQMGRVLDALRSAGRYRDALIIVTSNLGATEARVPADREHKPFDLDLIRVPLIVHRPGGVRTRPVQQLTQAIDLRPTILSLAGLAPPLCDGIDLSPLLDDSQDLPAMHSCVFTEDEQLGAAAAIDDFWVVQNRAEARQVPLDPTRTDLFSEDLPPIPSQKLAKTQSELDRFVGGPQLFVERRGGEYPVHLQIEPIEGIRRGEHVGAASQLEFNQQQSMRSGSFFTELRFAEQTSATELSGLRMWTHAEDPEFMLYYRRMDDGLLDESRIVVGSKTLNLSAVPRVVMRYGGEEWLDWPALSDGAVSEPVVDIVKTQGRLQFVTVRGEPGAKVKILLIVSPMDPEHDKAIGFWPTGTETGERIPGVPNAIWIRGESPMSFTFKNVSGTFAISVALEGQQVPTEKMRYLGKCFCSPSEVMLYLPSWLPGVHEGLNVDQHSSQGHFENGTVWIGRNTKRQLPNDQPLPNAEILQKLQTLERLD